MPINDIRIDAGQAEAAIEKLCAKLSNLRPLMAGISEELHSEMLLNFEHQGRPAWKDLSPTTRRMRAAKRKDPKGKILMVTGQLRSSVMTHTTDTSAGLTTNKVYAAIHQFGGKTGKNHAVEIPARPYMPFADNELQESTQIAIIDLVTDYFSHIGD